MLTPGQCGCSRARWQACLWPVDWGGAALCPHRLGASDMPFPLSLGLSLEWNERALLQTCFKS